MDRFVIKSKFQNIIALALHYYFKRLTFTFRLKGDYLVDKFDPIVAVFSLTVAF